LHIQRPFFKSEQTRSPSPDQSPTGRGPQSPIPRKSPICLWTPESESTRKSTIFFPQSPSPRKSRGSLPNSLGCSLGPSLPVRKCHQMSSKEHMQLGWAVRWDLSTHPGHPTAGRCGRVVPVLPLSVSSGFHPRDSRFVFRGSCLQNETNKDTITAGVVLLRSSRAMHSRAARCTLGHVTYFTSRKSCAVGPLHPRISSSSAPCLLSCGKWIRDVSYVCHYSNMSIHMIILAHPAGRVPPGDAT
jgi:hypothetical protein